MLHHGSRIEGSICDVTRETTPVPDRVQGPPRLLRWSQKFPHCSTPATA